MQNYWGGVKCAADFAAMDSPEFNNYWRNRGASDVTPEQFADFRYYALWCSAEGVQRLRDGAVI